MKATDILFGDDGDLLFENGDFAIGESDSQHIEDIMFASPGHWKQSPLVGADIRQSINGLLTGGLKRNIRLQLEADGYTVNSLSVTGETLTINAERK